MRKLTFLLGALLMHLVVFGQNEPATLEWEKTLGGPTNDGARHAILDEDNNIVIVGSSGTIGGDVTSNQGSSDFWVVKTDVSGEIIWEQSYGGSGSDVGVAIAQTDDGGYVIAGNSSSSDGDVPANKGGSDIWVIKLDNDGDLEWSKNFGGSDDDTATSIVIGDQGYLVAGYTWSDDGDITENQGMIDAWVFKIDLGGELLWQKTFGGSFIDAAHDATYTGDGYLVAAEAISQDGSISTEFGEYDGVIIKLDESGEVIWIKNYGSTSADNLRKIRTTADGGFLLAGFTRSAIPGSAPKGWDDFWFVKADSEGEIEWQKSYGGSEAEYGYDIIEASNGGYWIGGSSTSDNGDVPANYGGRDAFIGKLDANGDLLFGKNYGGSQTDEVFTLLEVEGGVVTLGRTGSNDHDVSGNNGQFDLWMAKFVDKNLGVEDVSFDNLLKIYPNPVIDVLNIQTNDPVLQVDVYAITGQLVKTSTDQVLDMSNLSNGLYLVTITTDRQVITKKIIKK